MIEGWNPIVFRSFNTEFSEKLYFHGNINHLNMGSAKITVLPNGSLKIDGKFEIVDKEGNAYNLQGREIISLCRCGLSANKPFCDGSHKGHFNHDAKAFDLPLKKK